MENRELIIFYVCGVAIILMFISYMIGITIYIGRLKRRLKLSERKDAAIDRIICFLDDNACINPRYRLDLLDLVYELKRISNNVMPVFEGHPAPPQPAPALQEIRSYRGWYSSDGKMSYDDIVLIDHYESRRENILNHAKGLWDRSPRDWPNLVMMFPGWMHVSMKYFYPCDMIVEISTMERYFSLKQDERTGKFAPFASVNQWPQIVKKNLDLIDAVAAAVAAPPICDDSKLPKQYAGWEITDKNDFIDALDQKDIDIVNSKMDELIQQGRDQMLKNPDNNRRAEFTFSEYSKPLELELPFSYLYIGEDLRGNVPQHERIEFIKIGSKCFDKIKE